MDTATQDQETSIICLLNKTSVVKSLYIVMDLNFIAHFQVI
jgi:hypothetical protein